MSHQMPASIAKRGALSRLHPAARDAHELPDREAALSMRLRTTELSIHGASGQDILLPLLFLRAAAAAA